MMTSCHYREQRPLILKCKFRVPIPWKRKNERKKDSELNENDNRLRDVSVLRRKLRPCHTILRKNSADAVEYSGSNSRSDTTFGERNIAALPINTTGFANDNRMFMPSSTSFSALAASGYGNGYDKNTFVRAFRQNHLTSNLLMKNRQDRMMEDKPWLHRSNIDSSRMFDLDPITRTSQAGWSVVVIFASLILSRVVRKFLMYIYRYCIQSVFNIKRHLFQNL